MIDKNSLTNTFNSSNIVSETDNDFICNIQAPCFQALSSIELDVIKLSKTQVKFRKNDNLTKQGAFASYIMYVLKGLAVQYMEGEQGKSYNLRIIKSGEFIGLSSVFYDDKFHYSSFALNDCQVMLVEKSAVLQVIAKNGMFGLSLFRRYTKQNVNLFESLKAVLYKQMAGRIAKTLLYINSFKDDNPEIFTLLSRKNIADFTGIATESAVKILKTLDKEQVIKLEGKDIIIIKTSYLKSLTING